MVYMVTYDLNGDGKDYESVQQTIKNASDGTYCRVCKSSWLIRSRKSSAEIANSIKAVIDKDDRFIVIEVKDNKHGWLPREKWDKINEILA